MLHISYKFFRVEVSSLQVFGAETQKQKAHRRQPLFALYGPCAHEGKSRLISLCDAVCTTDLRGSMTRYESHWFNLRLFSRVMLFGLAMSTYLPFSACQLLVDKALVQNWAFWEKVSGRSHEVV